MILRRFAVALVLAGSLLAPSLAAAADADTVIDDAPTAEAMTFDLFFMRPLGLVSTVLGTAVYIVALPVNIVTWNLVDPARRLVLAPAEYTFVRDLGDLD